MTGILIISIAAVWLIIVVLVLRLIISKVSSRILSGFLVLGVVLLVLPLPVADELFWGHQFKEMCAKKSGVELDSTNPQGRTVWFGGSQLAHIKLGTIDVQEMRVDIVDAITQDPVYHYYRLDAKGGLLIRFLGISEGDDPLTFRGHCQPRDLKSVNKNLNLKEIVRPIKAGVRKE